MKTQRVRSLTNILLVWVVCIVVFVVIMHWGPGDIMNRIRLVMLSAIVLGVIVAVGSLLGNRPKPVLLDRPTYAKLDELAAATNRRRETVVADLILEAWEANQVPQDKPEAEAESVESPETGPDPSEPAEPEPEPTDSPQPEASDDASH